MTQPISAVPAVDPTVHRAGELVALPPTQTLLACSGQTHRLTWSAGTLTAPDHDDLEGEQLLTALGAEAVPCGQVLTAWRAAAAEPRVLVLASRGPSDPLTAAVTPAWAAPATSGPAGTGGSSFGWYAYSPIRGGPSGASGQAGAAVGDGDPADPIPGLLRLGGGLPARLVASVITSWTVALRDGTAPAAVQPALTAALIGRVHLAVAQWLDEPAVDIEIGVLPPGQPATHTTTSGSHRLQLPFSWLTDVWVPGLATVLGRFTLDATARGPDLLLDTVTTDGHHDQLLLRRA